MSEADEWVGLRTVCHGCRSMREVIEQVDAHKFEVRTMILPGDGTIYRRVRTSFESADAVVEAPCPDCADDFDGAERDAPEWLLPGFVPPL